MVLWFDYYTVYDGRLVNMQLHEDGYNIRFFAGPTSHYIKYLYDLWMVKGVVMWYASKDLKRNAPKKVQAFNRDYIAR